MSLSTETLRIVRTSWRILAEDADALTEIFYAYLFGDNPRYRAMFANANMPKQRRKLAAALGLVVQNAHDFGPLIPTLKSLGARHGAWGVMAADYAAVGAALLASIEAQLGEDWRPETADAWAEAYGAVAEVMQAGEAETLRKSA